MDISAAMQQFYDDKGNISIPDQLTLSGMNEMLFAMAQMQGTQDSLLFRFHDYSASRGGEVVTWTRAQVNTKIKAVSVRLRQVTTPGDRVAVLANNSPEYLIGFIGALYAGTVPVPLYDPTEPGHGAHLTAVLESSTPTVVLTNRHSAAAVRGHFSDRPAGQRPRILTVDALPDSLAEDWVNPMAALMEHPELAPKAGDPAFLQYTSGSTRTPAGVVLTHRSIVTNVLQVFQAGQLQMPMRLVNWLPLHHDMGIILASFCLILGIPQDIMGPRDFIQDPGRWIRQLDEKGTVGEDAVNVYAAVPNFALELAARYADPAEREDLADVDLSHVEGIINGAEAVSLQSVDRFQEVFGPYGFRRTAMRPSYGLAEATVFVTTPQTEDRPRLRVFDREKLSEGTAVEVPADSGTAVPIMSVGEPGPNEYIVIVDPATGTELPSGSVGEVWIHGDNVAAGYLGREEETVETFRNVLPVGSRLNGGGEGSAAAGAPEDNWLRTGDLAVTVDGELYITGRIKDLVVIAGRNHYPQDIEATAQEATDQILPGVLAAFAATPGEGEDVEQLIIVAERDPEADPALDGDAAAAVRAAVTSVHGVSPAEVLIVDRGSVPRSSANKIARRVAAKAWAEGAFA
ncbi:MAG: FadD32-like long-chain-fatty-acid--AMP ligase [Corynebacterium provencense]|jgi:fatty acid CoA ligase FadD32|uniref:FadD32-like long-chain-fatty-acid--AMP ligase n=1 Tax=Corynebacterium provencense TaxID=1737425 RepID=UPI002989A59F|nr:FadD32-like long-chain-fatty-acid--AMP ligase [Corynebacterium provencense]